MIIKYEVPSYLERKFLDKNLEECQSIITGALLSNSDTLLKMELDTRISQDTILKEISELKELIKTNKVSFSQTTYATTTTSVTTTSDEAVIGTYVPTESNFDEEDEDGDFFG